MQEAQETWVQPLDWDNPLEEKLATHFSILAWEIPWTEEAGGLQSMGSQRMRHDWACIYIYIYIYTHTHTHTHINTYIHIYRTMWRDYWYQIYGIREGFLEVKIANGNLKIFKTLHHLATGFLCFSPHSFSDLCQAIPQSQRVRTALQKVFLSSEM